MITARDDIEARAEGMRVGVSDFLAKPVFRKQLANRIQAQLDTIATARAIEDALNRIEVVGDGADKDDAPLAVERSIRAALPRPAAFDCALTGLPLLLRVEATR